MNDEEKTGSVNIHPRNRMFEGQRIQHGLNGNHDINFETRIIQFLNFAQKEQYIYPKYIQNMVLSGSNLEVLFEVKRYVDLISGPSLVEALCM